MFYGHMCMCNPESKPHLLLYSTLMLKRNIFAVNSFDNKELAMQNSHYNNGNLGLTYLTTLPQHNDLELVFTKFGC